ncbi:hypothetical protein DL771_001832 [Monosporascus sp. 5C6A]|nr:hypothetical protein DL771_001832 [Monosporascus sp. 5C6A]
MIFGAIISERLFTLVVDSAPTSDSQMMSNAVEETSQVPDTGSKWVYPATMSIHANYPRAWDIPERLLAAFGSLHLLTQAGVLHRAQPAPRVRDYSPIGFALKPIGSYG